MRWNRPLSIALAVATLHGVNDAYFAFLSPLLPRVMERLDLSITLAATLMVTLAVAASLAQPVLGLLADRGQRRLLVVAGPVASGVFLSLIGVAPSYAVLVALLIAGGLGSAAFHPPGAAIAVRALEGRGSGLRHGFFSFGGAFGYAVGPLVAVALVARFGMEGLWVAMLPVLPLAALVYVLVPAGPQREPARSGRERRTPIRWSGPIGVVFGVSAASAFLQRSFLTLQPIAMAGDGFSEAIGAVVLSVYLGGQAVGTLVGGVLADRADRARTLTWLTLGSLAAHLLAFALPVGPAGFLVVALAGLLNQAILAPVVVIALEAEPDRAALSSGIVMGLAWATGSLAVLGAGAIADFIGPREAALLTTPVILIGTWLSRRPSLRMHRRPPVEGGGEEALS